MKFIIILGIFATSKLVDAQSCSTPDGDPGRCVNIYSCPHVAGLLKGPLPSLKNIEYVKRSKCNGPEAYSVCCGAEKKAAEAKVEVGNCESRLFVQPPDPSSKCCGLETNPGNKIVGGSATAIDQYPWLVVIEYETESGIRLHCGGALISSRYILTAAHCLTGPDFDDITPKNVRLGEYNTSNSGIDCTAADGCADPVLTIPIESTIPHPEYVHKTHRNDIGLIRLKYPAPYTDFIRPICLPTSDITLAPPRDLKLWAAGWGAVSKRIISSKVKQHIDLPYVSWQDCQPAYNVPRRRSTLWQKQLCAGGEKNRDSCKGDSGGPLMYENVRTYEAVGVISFGNYPCGVEDVPGVYTKVAEYIDWIRNNIRP